MKKIAALVCVLMSATFALTTGAESVFEEDAFGNINQRNVGVLEEQRFDRPHQHNLRHIEESRSLPAFNELEIRAPVEFHYQASGPNALQLQGSAESVKAIKAYVSGSKLVIERQHQGGLDTPVLTLSGGNLERVSVHSSANLDLSQLRGKRFALEVRGAADIKLKGKVQQCSIDAQGAGDIDQSELICEALELKIFGANDIEAHVTQRISGRLQGAGDITVHGQPAQRQVSIQGAYDIDYF